tara:strand:+ start:83 stop:820 length:738 start_codon:yes stop_codon:yes gene_type:complete
MIKFFRKIRQNLLMENKTGKYFKYAVGEIILVVIGILIALSINNWNENRKLVIKEKETYKNIITDLKRDLIQLETTINWAKSQQKVHYQIYNEIKGKNVQNEKLVYDIIIIPIPFHSHMEVNHLGVSKDLKDAEVAENINAYFKLLNDVKISVNEHNNDIKNEIVNFFSINGVFNLENTFTQKGVFDFDSRNQVLNHDKLIALKDEPFFQGFLVNFRMWTQNLISDGEKLIELNKDLVLFLESKK